MKFEMKPLNYFCQWKIAFNRSKGNTIYHWMSQKFILSLIKFEMKPSKEVAKNYYYGHFGHPAKLAYNFYNLQYGWI